jgi:hypothetical protein
MPLPNYINPPADINLMFEAVPKTITATSGVSAVIDMGVRNSAPPCRLVILPIAVTAGNIAVTLQQSDDVAFGSGVDSLQVFPTVSATQTEPMTRQLDNNLVTKRYTRLSYALAASSNVTIPQAFITTD